MSTESPISIELSAEEALVLFEFLSRSEDNQDALRIEDRAELIALWNLCSSLERVLVEPFRADYRQLVEKARIALRNRQLDGPHP